ncbi:unnamed protein product [Effrenium voratum]|nr:unnamed protein product [Effrenium voratum]
MEPLRFAFAFGCASGHINPSLAVTRRLVQQGHEVHYLSREQMRSAIEDTGAKFWNELEVESELYENREEDLMGATSALKKEQGLENESMLAGFMKLSCYSLELQLPGCIRWLQQLQPDAVAYCPLLCQDAAYAAEFLKLPKVAILTTAGPGSMAFTMQAFLDMSGSTAEELLEECRNYAPLQQNVANLKEKYGIEYQVERNLRNLGFLSAAASADVCLVTTTEDLQDPCPPQLTEAYEQAGAKFVTVGPLLDQAGAKRAACHKFNEAKTGAGDAHQDDDDDELMEQMRMAKSAGRKVVLASMGTAPGTSVWARLRAAGCLRMVKSEFGESELSTFQGDSLKNIAESAHKVVTGDSPDLGWHTKPMEGSGRKGLTGKQLCQAAWNGVFDAFGSDDPTAPLIILVTGPQPDALENLTVPSNAICRQMVPQVDLLRARVDVFLTHCGQNSFMESLVLGVPMVCCPGCVDQPTNAAKAEALGAALQVSRPVPEDGEEEAAMQSYQSEVASKLLRVLEEPGFRQKVQAVSQRIEEAGGVPRAAEHIVRTARPLPVLLNHRTLAAEAAEAHEANKAVEDEDGGMQRTFSGVGFALPIDTVVKNVQSMIEEGYVSRPSIGVELAPDSVSESLGMPGAMVMKARSEGRA